MCICCIWEIWDPFLMWTVFFHPPQTGHLNPERAAAVNAAMDVTSWSTGSPVSDILFLVWVHWKALWALQGVPRSMTKPPDGEKIVEDVPWRYPVDLIIIWRRNNEHTMNASAECKRCQVFQHIYKYVYDAACICIAFTNTKTWMHYTYHLSFSRKKQVMSQGSCITLCIIFGWK